MEGIFFSPCINLSVKGGIYLCFSLTKKSVYLSLKLIRVDQRFPNVLFDGKLFEEWELQMKQRKEYLQSRCFINLKEETLVRFQMGISLHHEYR